MNIIKGKKQEDFPFSALRPYIFLAYFEQNDLHITSCYVTYASFWYKLHLYLCFISPPFSSCEQHKRQMSKANCSSFLSLFLSIYFKENNIQKCSNTGWPWKNINFLACHLKFLFLQIDSRFSAMVMPLNEWLWQGQIFIFTSIIMVTLYWKEQVLLWT